MKKENRRSFLNKSVKASILMSLGLSGLAESTNASGNDNNNGNGLTNGSIFDQQPLGYAYNALEDIIDAMTMEIHYSKHAAAYSKNAKEAAIAENLSPSDSIEKLLSGISKYSQKMRNNAGGHYNHEMFWKCMRPKTTDNKPNGKMLAAIENDFGSFAAFKTKFSDAAKTRFGSGWAWLYKDSNGTLKVGSTANQDNPLMDLSSVEHKGQPLLCLDVWEHAYYLKYQNRRAEYIEKWWDLVNWDYVQIRWESN